jgi:hypothetical protein
MGFIVPAAIIMGLGLLSFVSSFLPWVRKGQGDSQPR